MPEQSDQALDQRSKGPGVLSRLLVELARGPGECPGEAPLLPGDRVGRFVVRREIGRGGFGLVYEALDAELGRAVALKCLRPGRSRSELRAEWLHAEAEAIARLDHPAIVTVYDVGTCDRGTYLVMELLHGETLAGRLARGPLPVDAALAIALEVAAALAHAHGRGLLHRDLKPGNVFLASDGRVKLLDFGLAHLVGAQEALAAGTPAYMAPEQARGGRVDARADVYSAAVVLQETLAVGRVPRRLAALLADARSADPADRPADGAAWRDELLAIARGRARRRARRRAFAVAVAGVTLGLAVAAVGIWREWREAPVPGSTAAAVGTGSEPGETELDALRRAGSPDDMTASLEAYRLYFRALDCLDRTVGFEPCVADLRRAVELDPGFALAHYQLAQSAQWVGMPLAEAQATVRRALRHLGRVPPREREKIRALAAQLAGREDEAVALYLEAAAAAPEDRVLAQHVGDFFLARNEPELALPHLRRAMALSARPGATAVYLALALGAAGREPELRALAAQLERATPDTTARLGLAFARASLGDLEGATAAAREARIAAVEEGERVEADHWWLVLRTQLDPHSAIVDLRRDCSRSGTVALAAALSLTGRRAESTRLMEGRVRRECGDADIPPASFAWHAWTAALVAGTGDATRTWRHARRAAELNVVLGASLAVHLAYLGDLAHAARLAGPLAIGSPRRRVYDAVVRWRSGDRASAREELRELARTSPSTAPPPILPASFLYGELAAELGDDREAIAALRRFRSLFFPIPQFWTWAYPKALYLEARAHERLGEVALARERIAALLELWRDADRDLPLLREARALAARVGATSGAPVEPVRLGR